MDLQTHLDKRIDTPVYGILRVNLMMFFQSVLGLDFDEHTILSICAALDTNAFEIRKTDQKIRALYPNAAMLAHNCTCNTRHYFGDDNELFFIATVGIKKGEVLYTTYGQALQVIEFFYYLYQAHALTCFKSFFFLPPEHHSTSLPLAYEQVLRLYLSTVFRLHWTGFIRGLHRLSKMLQR